MTKPKKGNVPWRGALEFAGFNVNVALHSRVRKTRNESFKTVDIDGNVLEHKSQYVDAEGNESTTYKGVHVDGPKSGPKAKYAPLEQDVVDQITASMRTKVAKADAFVPVEEIDFALAIDRFVVRPDDNVPGAEQAVGILWNGLRARKAAWVSQVAISSQDALLVLYATETDFRGVLLPFEHELYPVPEPEFEVDTKAQALAGKVIDKMHGGVTEFDHEHYVSEYQVRKAQLLAQAVAGVVPQEDEPEFDDKPETPDLMAMLEASLEQADDKEAVTA
jgi:non-homologous end joining protein Ku